MKYFIVYNDKTHIPYIKRLLHTVQQFGKDFKIIMFNKENLEREFVERNIHILNCKRGGGYWLWKPYIINETLRNIKDGDIVFYLDSKYLFTEDFTGLYSEHLTNNDILVWRNKPNESENLMKHWCKMDVIMKYGMYDKVFNENALDCWAGAVVIRKTDKTVQMMQEWLEMASNYENITDSPSKIPNSPLFREHRHDQSLLSIVLHKNNIHLPFFEKRYLNNVRSPY